MCDFQDWQLSLSWSASKRLELDIMQNTLKAALLILWKPSLNKGKWDSHHTSSLLFPYMSFITKVEQQYIFKLHLKIRVQSKTPNPILIFMLVRLLWMANPEWKHSPLLCIMRRSWKIIKLQLLGKREKTFSKHVRFYWHTYHHLSLRNR